MQIKNILEELESKNMDSMLVLKPENITYLANFRPSSFSILILKDEPVLYISKMDFEEVPENIDLNVEEFKSLDKVIESLKDKKELILGIESSMSVSLYKKFIKEFEIKTTDLIETYRRIKSKKEVEYIEEAINIAEKSFKATKIEGYDNLVAAELNYNMMANGSPKPAFETIVASGKNSSKPHAYVQPKKLENPVLMDWGAIYNNYCSDISRTLVESERQYEILEIVIEAQKEAIKVIKPGIKASYIDKVARDVMAEYGFENNFIHSTGHGLGLDVHESPSLSRREELKIEKGMVITVEPGLYFEGEFGVRIEDDILVKNSAKVLTKLKTII
ncbi:MAG: M24 family metallopeptidase [Methanomicrobiales archaeon]